MALSLAPSSTMPLAAAQPVGASQGVLRGRRTETVAFSSMHSGTTGVQGSGCSSMFAAGLDQLALATRSAGCHLRVSRASDRQPRRPVVAALFGLGIPELAVIAGVAVVLFGPKQLPEIGKSLGKTVKSFQEAAKEFQTEIKTAAEEATENFEEALEAGKKADGDAIKKVDVEVVKKADDKEKAK